MSASMSASERTTHRLFLEAPLAAGERTACNPEQANYLLNVLRLGAGAEILVFNGRDGEWRAASSRSASAAARSNAWSGRARRPGARHPLPLCAAQARTPRLHGAEVDRDGRRQAAAGADAAHDRCARQRRAHARQRYRGGRAVRHPAGAGGGRAGEARCACCNPGIRRARSCSATRRRRWRARLRRSPNWKVDHWPYSSGPKAALIRASRRCCGKSRSRCRSRSGRASCARIRRRWQPWRLSTPQLATGASTPKGAERFRGPA